MNKLFSFIRKYGTDTFHEVVIDYDAKDSKTIMSLELREAFRQAVESREYHKWLKGEESYDDNRDDDDRWPIDSEYFS